MSATTCTGTSASEQRGWTYVAPPAEPLKAGDVVELRSGGQTMVIDSIESETAMVVWMNGGKVCDGFLGLHLIRRHVPFIDIGWSPNLAQTPADPAHGDKWLGAWAIALIVIVAAILIGGGAK